MKKCLPPSTGSGGPPNRDRETVSWLSLWDIPESSSLIDGTEGKIGTEFARLGEGDRLRCGCMIRKLFCDPCDIDLERRPVAAGDDEEGGDCTSGLGTFGDITADGLGVVFESVSMGTTICGGDMGL